MDIFNNREIAIGLWLLAVIGWAATYTPVRASFGKVLEAFGNRKILIPFGLMAAYIALLVMALSEAGLWHWGQLKNTILWSLSVAAVSLLRIPEIEENGRYFRHAIKDNLKLIAVLEFVITFYTFPLWGELLLVPVATILVAMHAFAERKEEYAPVSALIGWILAALGIGLTVYAVYMLATDFGRFAQAGTLTDFALPIVLTLMFLPFLYLLALFVTYENAFLRLNRTFRDPPLRRYAKRAALVRLHVQRALLKRWLRNVQGRTPHDGAAVRASIAQVKELARRENNPAAVPLSEGWSPYAAQKYLIAEGLSPGDYHQDQIDETEWFASSPYLEIGDRLFPNRIAYYIEGNERAATLLKLVGDFSDPASEDEARRRFADIARTLFKKALNQDMPEHIEASIMSETDAHVAIDGKMIELERRPWPTRKGHELRFSIRNVPAA